MTERVATVSAQIPIDWGEREQERGVLVCVGVDFILAMGGALVLGAALPFAWGPGLTSAAVTIALLVRAERRRWAMAVVLALLVALGAARAWRSVARHEEARDAAARVMPAPMRCAGHAVVTSSPVRIRGAPRWNAHAEITECEGATFAWSGDLTLYGGPAIALARGDEVDVVAQLAPPQRLWNEPTGDPRPGEARRGVTRSGGVLSVRITQPAQGMTAWIDRWRARVRNRIEATFPGDTASMARALVLGESDLSIDDEADFRASGLAHLLAVSGMHVVLVIAGGVGALRALLVRIEALSARMEVGRIAAGAGIPATWVYAQFAGASGSALRAAWMISAVLLARALGRRGDGTRAFALSLIAMAIADPLVIFDVSFLLSGAATAGLLAFARPLGARFEAALPSFAAPVARSAATTLAVTIPCAPILACLAPALPIGSVFANLVAVPVGEVVALPMCLAHALLAPWPAAELGCATAAAGALRIVRAIARAFAHVPAMALPVPAPTAWQLAAMGIALLAFVWLPHKRRVPALAACAAFALVAEIGAQRAGAPRGELRVTFLDVAQGDAALIDLPNGEAMLVDGGGLVGSPIDTGQRVIAPVLRARRRDALALAILSHPHPDHFGGLATGLAACRVGALWDTGQGEREGLEGGYAALLASARSRGVPVVRPDGFCGPRDLGWVHLDVLAPCPGPSSDRGPNDNSIVLRIVFGERAFLFMGDAEHEEEQDLLRVAPDRLRADVLKVGHHGSRTSSSPEILRAIAPREAVISAGARNRFGHPHASTLRSLAAAGARVWRTDRDGSITIRTDGHALDVQTARGDP